MLVLAALLAALQPLAFNACCTSAQIIAGRGLFSELSAVNSSGAPFDHTKLARWDDGPDDGGLPRWSPVKEGLEAWGFDQESDRVLALAFVPANGQESPRLSNSLWIGGHFQKKYEHSPEKYALLRLPLRLSAAEPDRPMRHFCTENYESGTVYALHVAAGCPGSAPSRQIFVGGDFTWTHGGGCDVNHKTQDKEKTLRPYIARYVDSDGGCVWEALPPDRHEAGDEGAPQSAIHMLAYDEKAHVLYAGGRKGPIHKYQFPTDSTCAGIKGTWSALEAVGIGSGERPLDILFDSVLGLGFVAFAGPPGSSLNGVRVFTRGSEPSSYPSLEHSSVHFSALVDGADPEHGRRGLFAAGNSSRCPALWFLPLDGRAPAGWQDRMLGNSQGCAPPDIPGEDIVQDLAFVPETNLLVLGGHFYEVSGTKASNIVLSRDGGRTWSSLVGVNEAAGEGLSASSCSECGAPVRAILAIPQLHVTRVEPGHASPLGKDFTLTLHGSGFRVLPSSKEGLTLVVGDTTCATSDWTSDSTVTCALAAGLGADLRVISALSDAGGYFATWGDARFSYSAPLLGRDDSVLTDPVHVSVGGGGITVFGKNFGGYAPEQVTVRIGHSNCSGVQWSSDSSLSCAVAPGAVTEGSEAASLTTLELPVSIEIHGRAAQSRSLSFSYSPPRVNHTQPSAVPNAGATCVTLFGESFGSQPTLLQRFVELKSTIEEKDCLAHSTAGCAGWISDSTISCPAPRGVGFVEMTVRVADQTCTQGCSHGSSPESSVLKYAPPRVTDILPAGGGVPIRLPPQTGGDITIRGSEFGTERSDVKFVKIGSSECAKLHWGKESIICTTAPGAGAELKLRINVGGQVEEAQQLFEYSEPVVLSLTPALLPRDGAFKITVRGRNFAPDPSPYSPVWVRTDDPETEHVGSIISVTHTDGVQGGGAGGAGGADGATAELIMRAPEMPATGPAAFFVRAGAKQKSAKLSCAPDTRAGVCVHFSRRSQSISCSVVLRSGGTGWGLVEASEDGAGRPVYNLTIWKQELAGFLGMPRADLIYIIDIAPQATQRGWADVRALQRAATWQAGDNLPPYRHAGPEGGAAAVRQVGATLEVTLFILSDIGEGNDWSYKVFLESLRGSLASWAGRQNLRSRFGVVSLKVGEEPAQSTGEVEIGAPSAPLEAPQAQIGFTCMGGSQAGQPCAGNSSRMTPEQAELACPGGGSCVFSGGVGGGIAASWSFGAILGGFVVAGIAAIAVGMKLSADHRRKKRAKEAVRLQQQRKVEEQHEQQQASTPDDEEDGLHDP